MQKTYDYLWIAELFGHEWLRIHCQITKVKMTYRKYKLKAPFTKVK